MTPTQLSAAVELAHQIAARYRRRVWWASPEDMSQEALAAMVRAAVTFDPAVGKPWRAYAYEAGVRAVWTLLWRESAPVSAPAKQVRALRGLHRVPLDAVLPEVGQWPDQAYDAKEWHRRAAEAIAARLAPMGEGAAVALEVLLLEERPAAVAERLGVAPARVYRLAAQARRRLSMDPNSYLLWKEIP